MRFDLCMGRACLLAAAMAAPLLLPNPIQAGVTNPDLSAIGQVFGGMTDDAASPDAKEPTLKLGEAEVVLDAYLNPYFKGWLTISGSEDGFALEEAYTSMVKGLPWGLGIKAGKYRLGFGKTNPSHPHAYPFIATPRSLASLLPGGGDGFNETAVQVSDFLPMPGDWASTVSVDLLQGKQFHPADSGLNAEATRLGWLGRWANDFLLGDRGALETGISGATGTDDVGRDSRAYLFGADVKAKFYLEGASQLTMVAEGVFNHGHTADTAAHSFAAEDRKGFNVWADYRYHTQYNGGLFYEQWERQGQASSTDRAFRVFAGYAVLEESTLLRASYEYFMPDGGGAVNTVALQLLFSMGPHKAHQF